MRAACKRVGCEEKQREAVIGDARAAEETVRNKGIGGQAAAQADDGEECRQLAYGRLRRGGNNYRLLPQRLAVADFNLLRQTKIEHSAEDARCDITKEHRSVGGIEIQTPPTLCQERQTCGQRSERST